MKQYYIYILSNNDNSVFYTGITNNLVRRTFEHKSKLVEGFTAKYNISKLLYYESVGNPISAIDREKQIKKFSRKKKFELILKQNQNLQDLYDKIIIQQ